LFEKCHLIDYCGPNSEEIDEEEVFVLSSSAKFSSSRKKDCINELAVVDSQASARISWNIFGSCNFPAVKEPHTPTEERAAN